MVHRLQIGSLLAPALALLVASQACGGRGTGAAAGGPSPAEPEMRALWVDSFNSGLRSPAEIDGLVSRAKQGNLNAIVAQVRRNAQGLYARSLEGWVESYVPPAGFDPLQDLVTKAHAQGLEVHAWANIGPVFSGNPDVPTSSFPCGRPCDPNHPFNRHGPGTSEEENWLTRAHPAWPEGTTFGGQRQSPSGLWYLDLGHPAAARYTIDVLLHLLRSYDVDGLHLDYVRYPEMPVADPRPAGGLAFAIGYNPTSVARFDAAYGRPEGSLPDPGDPSWSEWRREQVRSFVRRLSLEAAAVRPRARLSAALVAFYRGPNPVEPRTFAQTEAYTRVFQDWEGWMREGILDTAVPMAYKSQHLDSHVTQFREWIEFTKNAQHARQAVIGLGAYMNSLEGTLAQAGEARAPSATGAKGHGLCFFSFAATNQAVPPLPERPRDELFRALAVDGAYTAKAPFDQTAPVPAMPWKTGPSGGALLVQVLDAAGGPADGARVVLRRVAAGPDEAPLVQYADGSGFVGASGFAPGTYEVVVDLPGAEERATIPDPIVPGHVRRVTLRLAGPARGPAVRAPHVPLPSERTDRLRGVSPLEEWLSREPVPDDLRAERPERE